MFKTVLISFVCLIAFAGFSSAQTQPLLPVISFEEHPMTHNFHIASDGKYYYTVNGGRAALGQIKKYSLSGELLATFSMNLDLRSIMYSSTTKKFYVCSADKNIYMIISMELGDYKPVLRNFYTNQHAGLALSPDGKQLYYFEEGSLSIYKFPSGKFIKTIKGLSCGSSFSQGSVTVAADSRYIYTWNSEIQRVYVYDLEGKKIKEVELSLGTFGGSLSCANGFIFVSEDGNYNKGTWYGYDIWKN